jgi:rod shape determining protein RodA
VLAMVGLAMIFSATEKTLSAKGIDPAYYLKRQVTWLVLGTVVLMFVASFDYRQVKVYAPIFYGATLGLLIVVLTPLGTVVNGARRWFEFFGFQFAPAEVMKLALVAMLSSYLSEIRHELTMREVVNATLLTIFPAFFIFIQPDLGTSLVLIAVLTGLLIVAGAKLRYLAVLAVAGLLVVGLAFQVGVFDKYQVNRLLSFIDPSRDPESTGYNAVQAEIAMGSGGLTGYGYRNGPQTALDFVPEQQTDFVFTVVGEEFGFVGTMFVLSLYAFLAWRAIRISQLAKDPFGTYLAAGIASMFVFQIFVNVGMTIRLMPITGIPLPFVSYGGTSTLVNFAAVGLLLNIHMRRLR